MPPWRDTYGEALIIIVRTVEFEADEGIIAGVERNESKSLRNVGLCKEGRIVGVYDDHSVIEGGVFRLGAVAGDVCID